MPAVMSAPLVRLASTTTVPRVIPATMRLRMGNDCLSAFRLNGNWVSTAPDPAIRSNRPAFSGGKMILMKVPVSQTARQMQGCDPDMKTAYSYVRFSTSQQKLGASGGRQMEAAVEWCKSNGYILSNDRFLDEGRSAHKGK